MKKVSASSAGKTKTLHREWNEQPDILQDISTAQDGSAWFRELLSGRLCFAVFLHNSIFLSPPGDFIFKAAAGWRVHTLMVFAFVLVF